jgi:hypothetical protein
MLALALQGYCLAQVLLLLLHPEQDTSLIHHNTSALIVVHHRRTGYHVRVFTQYYIDASPEAPNPRGLWGSLDNQTVVVRVSRSSGSSSSSSSSTHSSITAVYY